MIQLITQSVYCTLFVLISTNLNLQSYAAEPNKPKSKTPQEMDKIRAKVLRCWMEIEVEDEKGIVKDPNKLYGYRFGAEERSTWCRRGELSLGFDKRNRVIVRPDRDPMQVDFLSMNGQATKFFVTPCIFKFNGERMILIEPTTGGAPYFREDGNYKNRPTSFTPTKENKYRKMTLKPCFLYDED